MHVLLALSAFEAATLKVLPKNGSEWHHIRSAAFPQHFRTTHFQLSERLAEIISRMLSEDPAQRPSAEQVFVELEMKEVEMLKRQVLIEKNTTKLLTR